MMLITDQTGHVKKFLATIPADLFGGPRFHGFPPGTDSSWMPMPIEAISKPHLKIEFAHSLKK
jgi:hypothetical protein